MTRTADASLRSPMIAVVRFAKADTPVPPDQQRRLQAETLWRNRAAIRQRAETLVMSRLVDLGIDPAAPSGQIYVRIMPSDTFGEARYSVRLRVGF